MAAVRLALIYGSTRQGRLCDKVAGWAIGQIEQRGGFALDVIDPAAMALPARHETEPNAAVQDLRRRIDEADAFVVVTPEYNHSFPAAVKLVIDLVGAPWRAKPVGFVSYGGVSGGLRAVEQLRLVFAELHAVGIRDSVSFALVRSFIDGEGRFTPSPQAHAAMALMLRQLDWWAAALGEARQRRPYAEAAA